jgi:hypothetical protein
MTHSGHGLVIGETQNSLTALYPITTILLVNIELTPQQATQLERIARNAGKPASQILLESAQFVLDFAEQLQRPAESQKFLPEKDLEERLSQLLRR